MIDRYDAARLLSFDRDPLTREQTVEVAHEALLREWPRLRSWLDEDRDGLRLHRHITTSAAAWEAGDRDEGELYRGGRLEAAGLWAGEHADDLNESELGFVAASVEQQRLAERARARSARRLRRLLVATAIIALIALVAGGVAWHQQSEAAASRRAADLAAREATTQRDAATVAATDAQQQRQSALDAAFASDTERMAAIAPRLAKTDPSLGMLVAAEANGRTKDPATLGALQDVLAADTTLGYIRPGSTSTSDYTLLQVSYDTAGNIVTFGGTPKDGGWNEEIIVWDGSTHERLRQIPAPKSAISESGTRMVAIGGNEAAWIDDDRHLWVADLTTGTVADHGAWGGSGVGIEGRSGRIVVVSVGGEVLVFDHGQETPHWRSSGDSAKSATPAYVAFNGSGTKVYVSRSQGVRAFDMATGDDLGHIDYVAPHEVNEFVAPLDSDDSKVIIGNTYQPVLGNLNDGTYTEFRLPLANLDPINIVPVGGDRHALIDFRGSVIISNPTGAVLVGPIELHLGRTWAAALAPNGRTMVVGGDSGAAVIALDASNLMRTTLAAPA